MVTNTKIKASVDEHGRHSGLLMLKKVMQNEPFIKCIWVKDKWVNE